MRRTEQLLTFVSTIFAVAAVVGVPETAEPCSRPAPVLELRADTATTEGVSPDGVFVFPVEATGGDLEAYRRALSVEVAGPGGGPVGGSTRVVAVWRSVAAGFSSQFDMDPRRWLVVWKPGQKLQANATYEVSFQVDESELRSGTSLVSHREPDSVSVTTGGQDRPPLPGLEDVDFEVGHANPSRNGATSCTRPDAGGLCPRCSISDRTETVYLRAILSEADLRPDVVYQLEPTGSVLIDRQSRAWGTAKEQGPPGRSPTVHFDAGVTEVCGRLVAKSLVDGETVESMQTCLDAPDAPDDPDDPGPGPDAYDGVDANSSDAGGLDWDGSERAGQGGCGCSTSNPSTSNLAPLALFLLGLASVRRRRRAQ